MAGACERAPGGEVDRRPIRSRQTRLAQRAAAWLVARRVRADAISIAGMVAAIAAGVLFAATTWWPALATASWLGGAALIQLRLVANLLDGMVAIAAGTASAVGELYNEVPDRIADTAVMVGLGCAAGGDVHLGLIAALAAMSTAYVRAVGKANGAGSDFRGPMAKQHRMFLVTVTATACGLLPARWMPTSSGLGLPGWVLLVIVVGSLATSGRRLVGIAARLRGAA